MPQLYPAVRNEAFAILDIDKNEQEFALNYAKANGYLPNLAICVSADDGEGGALISDFIADNGVFKHTQCFPLYYYEKLESSDSGLFGENLPKEAHIFRRKSAIRDEALAEFQRIYKDSSIDKEAIFYYIYALLNHKIYKDKYKDNLSKMLPRIPFMREFRAFEKAGRELAHLHINYESFAKDSSALACLRADVKESKQDSLFYTNMQEKAKQDIANLSEADFTIPDKMRFIIKGRKDVIFLNNHIAIVNIPPKAYKFIINGKSAIEWIMERYQVKTDKDSGIINDPNLYECQSGALAGMKGGKYALNLLLSIIEVSKKSVEIIESMPEYELLAH